jgi:hypothetical protein
MIHGVVTLSARTGALSVIALSMLVPVALPVDASTAYRYWSYWNADPGASQWRYATEGSGTHVPVDGSVEGWRFGIAGDESRISPVTLPDFTSICGPRTESGDSEQRDSKRIALVIDPGTPAEAPDGESPRTLITSCVTTASASTGLQILQSVAEVRMESGFVCGIDGYPVRECAPIVDIPEPVASMEIVATSAVDQPADVALPEPQRAPDTGTPLITAVTLSLLALAGFGVWRHRRRERV